MFFFQKSYLFSWAAECKAILELWATETAGRKEVYKVIA